MEKRIQRSYSANYRRDAVKLAQEIGGSAAARQLDIPADILYSWISKAKQGALPQAPIAPDPKASLSLAEEVKELKRANTQLRQENARLIKEREILEGATAFFASRRKK